MRLRLLRLSATALPSATLTCISYTNVELKCCGVNRVDSARRDQAAHGRSPPAWPGNAVRGHAGLLGSHPGGVNRRRTIRSVARSSGHSRQPLEPVPGRRARHDLIGTAGLRPRRQRHRAQAPPGPGQPGCRARRSALRRPGGEPARQADVRVPQRACRDGGGRAHDRALVAAGMAQQMTMVIAWRAS